MKAMRCLVISTMVLSVLNVMRTPSHAVANWARKYGVECSTCHSPVVPRLNKSGQQFRKMGFRMPTEVGKKPDYKEIGEFLSFRQRTRYRLQAHAGGANVPTRNEFRFNDVTMFYEGPVTPNLTTMIELERPTNEEGLELQYFGSWTKGDLDNYWSVRAGNMRAVRVGYGGFDRPTGISTPNILGNDLTTGAISSPFTIGDTSVGVEINRGWKDDNRLYLQVRNGNTAEAEDNVNGGLDKDFLLAYERLLDERGSALTIFGYKGQSHLANLAAGVDAVDLNGDDKVSDAEGQVDSARIGLTFSFLTKTKNEKTLPWEIQGGYARGKDDAPSGQATPDITGDGFYLQLQKNLRKEAAVFARYDTVDQDAGDDVAGDQKTKWITLGAVKNMNDHWRMAIELQRIDRPTTATVTETENVLTFESMINF